MDRLNEHHITNDSTCFLHHVRAEKGNSRRPKMLSDKQPSPKRVLDGCSGYRFHPTVNSKNYGPLQVSSNPVVDVGPTTRPPLPTSNNQQRIATTKDNQKQRPYHFSPKQCNSDQKDPKETKARKLLDKSPTHTTNNHGHHDTEQASDGRFR